MPYKSTLGLWKVSGLWTVTHVDLLCANAFKLAKEAHIAAEAPQS